MSDQEDKSEDSPVNPKYQDKRTIDDLIEELRYFSMSLLKITSVKFVVEKKGEVASISERGRTTLNGGRG
jgi:hypothetical protein